MTQAVCKSSLREAKTNYRTHQSCFSFIRFGSCEHGQRHPHSITILDGPYIIAKQMSAREHRQTFDVARSGARGWEGSSFFANRYCLSVICIRGWVGDRKQAHSGP
ncbi:hypothetical protein K503DRAFT_602899 [Rhizopogon vinicolor AM-OR11-026]|uniref:Uncharacterized protein n=1 Tax=Rhizopogon vinicolor AM-OR11-026 TaxID=1314800 RepID=A0A1B7N6U9_9AGAM|nr:hypothetical protein K503DRAFT_602899 [Rhizopogon vinicolor AM-OR11-026]